MSNDLSDEYLRSLSDSKLQDLLEQLDAIWDRLDRKSDPRGDYTREQSQIGDDQERVRCLLNERAHAGVEKPPVG